MLADRLIERIVEPPEQMKLIRAKLGNDFPGIAFQIAPYMSAQQIGIIWDRSLVDDVKVREAVADFDCGIRQLAGKPVWFFAYISTPHGTA
jgi:hypothetical protein